MNTFENQHRRWSASLSQTSGENIFLIEIVSLVNPELYITTPFRSLGYW
nr:hypothetical protein [Klebsiella pneumoniae]